MSACLHPAAIGLADLVALAFMGAGFLLCLFSSWSARDTWKSDMALWILGAAALQVAGVAVLLIAKASVQ